MNTNTINTVNHITENTTLGELLAILNLGDKPHETPTPKMLRETAGNLEHFTRTAAARFATVPGYRIIRRKDQYMRQKKMEPRNSRNEQRFHERCNKEKGAEEQIKGVFDRILDEVAKEMDRGYMEAGKTLAELFRAVATAAAKLPDLELVE